MIALQRELTVWILAKENSALKTNMISLKPSLSVPRYGVTAIDVASPGKTDDCIELSAFRSLKAPIRSDSIGALATLDECKRFTGLSSRELILGVSPSPRHYATLKAYLRSSHGDALEVRNMLMHDLRSYLEIGARHFAADQLIVLRIFLADPLRGRPLKTLVTVREAKVIDMSAISGTRRSKAMGRSPCSRALTTRRR